MLAALAGRTHAVLTAVALWNEGRLRQVLDTSYVTFRAIDADEGRRYWASGEPAGKAGGYAIQGLGAVFVAAHRGQLFRRDGLAAVPDRGAPRCRGRTALAGGVSGRNAAFAPLVQPMSPLVCHPA